MKDFLEETLAKLIADFGMGEILCALGRVSATPLDNFPRHFMDAFAAIDGQTGGHNYVNLVQLREMLSSYPVKQFDAGLSLLISTKRFTVAEPDPRYTLNEKEVAALYRDGPEKSCLFVCKVPRPLQLPRSEPQRSERTQRLTQLRDKVEANGR